MKVNMQKIDVALELLFAAFTSKTEPNKFAADDAYKTQTQMDIGYVSVCFVWIHSNSIVGIIVLCFGFYRNANPYLYKICSIV